MAKLTAKKRKSLRGSQFALPGRHYPIEDKAHGKNALSRVAQHGSPSEKAEVRKRVHAKFPDIGSKKVKSKKKHHRKKISSTKG